MAEIITLTVKQVGVSEAEKSLNNMLTTIKAINSTPINVSVTGSGAKAAEQYKETVTATQTEVKKLSQSFKDTEKSGDSLLKNVIKNAQWYYISGAVSAATRSFKDAIAAMKEADAEMVSIQKVTGYTKDQMDRLSDSAYALASAYGRTAQEILSAETTFARAGYTDQIEDLAELAVLTQNVGDVNADTASKFLIAADAAWKLGGNEKELTEIIDGMNNVTNKNAVDMKALTEGLTVSASAFAEAGESAQTYTAMVGAGVAATQRSGNEVARAMRTIIMNVRQIRGETEDGELIDGESIANAAKALKEYADISTLQNGELRKTYDVLDELAGKWENLGSVAKSAITEALAGKYRANILSALLNDWDSVSKMMQDYADGVGSALEENEFYLQSWDAKTKQLQSTWTEFVAKTVDEDWIKGLISSVTWLIEGIGSLGNALLILGGIIATFKMPSILSFLSSAVSGIGRLIAMIKLATTNFTAFSLVANTTQLAIGAITAAITLGIVAYNKIKQAQEEARQKTIDAGNAAAQEAESLKDLYQSYTDAKKAYEDGTGSKTALREATEKLSKSLGTETENIDTLTLRYGSYKVAIDETTKALDKNTEAQLKSQLYDAKAATLSAKQNVLDVSYFKNRNVDDIGEALRYYDERIRERNRMLDEGDTDSAYFKGISKEIADLKPVIEEYNTALENQKNIEGTLQALRDGTLDSYERETDVISQNSDALDENADAASKNAEKIAEAAKTLKQQESDLETVSQALAEYQQTGRISATTMKSLMGISSQYISILTDENGKLSVTEARLRDVVDAVLDDIDATEDLAGVTKSSSGAMDSFVSGLINAANQTGATEDEVNDLVAQIIIFNNTSLDVSGKIAALQALALQGGVTRSVLAGISTDAIGKDSEMTVAEAQKKYGMPLQEAERYIASQKKKAQNNDQALLDYWNKLAEKIPETSGTSSGGGGGGGSSSDANLDAHKEKVALLKSELTLMEKQGASEEDQKNKMRQIQQALHAQAEYLRSIGANQSDINDLSAEWWEWQEKINGELKNTDDLLSELENALQDSIDRESDALDDEIAAIDAQIDALKKRKDSKDEELTLEEKILAVQQAQKNLADARNERTIRQYNARSGQWEWVADEKNIQSAEEALDKAKKDLEDFKDELAYNAELAALEARKDAIQAQQDNLDRQYKNFLNSLKEKTRGIGEILQDIWKNATPELKAIILENAELFKALGVDVTELSDAITAASNRIVKVGADGKAPSGLQVGDRVVTGGGTYEITGVNPDGTYESKLVDKNQTSYNYNGKYDDAPGGNSDSSGSSGSSGGSYSGTVYAEPNDGGSGYYKISSAAGLKFLNTASAGDTMRGGDGSYWVKNRNGTTSITDAYGRKFTVYDKGGVLRGLGGIKATSADEMVLPPDITSKMLTPVADERFERRIKELGFLYGAKNTLPMESGARFDNHAIGTQHNGNVYQLGGISISEGKARSTSVYELARMAQTLSISSGS